MWAYNLQQCQNSHLALSCLWSGLFLSQQLMERYRGRQWALPSIHHQGGKQQVPQGLEAQEIFLFLSGAAKLSSCCSLSPVQAELCPVESCLHQQDLTHCPATPGMRVGSSLFWLTLFRASQSGRVGRSSAAQAEQKPCWWNKNAGGHEEALCLQPHRNQAGLTSGGNNFAFPKQPSPCHDRSQGRAEAFWESRVCTGWFALGLNHLLICTVIPA